MEKDDAKVIADGIVKGFEKMANSTERSSERNAQAIVESSEKNAQAIRESSEMNTQAIIKSSERNAQAILDGFRETAKLIGRSLGGTRAELMMDCLLAKANGSGKIPEPGSEEWNDCKKIADKVLEEF